MQKRVNLGAWPALPRTAPIPTPRPSKPPVLPDSPPVPTPRPITYEEMLREAVEVIQPQGQFDDDAMRRTISDFSAAVPITDEDIVAIETSGGTVSVDAQRAALETYIRQVDQEKVDRAALEAELVRAVDEATTPWWISPHGISGGQGIVSGDFTPGDFLDDLWGIVPKSIHPASEAAILKRAAELRAQGLSAQQAVQQTFRDLNVIRTRKPYGARYKESLLMTLEDAEKLDHLDIFDRARARSNAGRSGPYPTVRKAYRRHPDRPGGEYYDLPFPNNLRPAR